MHVERQARRHFNSGKWPQRRLRSGVCAPFRLLPPHNCLEYRITGGCLLWATRPFITWKYCILASCEVGIGLPGTSAIQKRLT